jgi:hypothetical protein
VEASASSLYAEVTPQTVWDVTLAGWPPAGRAHPSVHLPGCGPAQRGGRHPTHAAPRLVGRSVPPRSLCSHFVPVSCYEAAMFCLLAAFQLPLSDCCPFSAPSSAHRFAVQHVEAASSRNTLSASARSPHVRPPSLCGHCRGVRGAAWATVAAQYVGAFVFLYKLADRLPLPALSPPSPSLLDDPPSSSPRDTSNGTPTTSGSKGAQTGSGAAGRGTRKRVRRVGPPFQLQWGALPSHDEMQAFMSLGGTLVLRSLCGMVRTCADPADRGFAQEIRTQHWRTSRGISKLHSCW